MTRLDGQEKGYVQTVRATGMGLGARRGATRLVRPASPDQGARRPLRLGGGARYLAAGQPTGASADTGAAGRADYDRERRHHAAPGGRNRRSDLVPLAGET